MRSFRFTDEEAALLDHYAASYGTQKAAVMAGLRALAGGSHMTKGQVLDYLKRRLKD
jgi:hypothetical protein